MTSLNYIDKIDKSLDFSLVEKTNYAFETMLTLAESSNHAAQRWIADSYYYGQGIEQDMKKALRWYLMAAEGGDLIAQGFIGLCLEHTQSNLETLNLNMSDWFENRLI